MMVPRMIEAAVQSEDGSAHWGIHRFGVLPSPGDRIVLGNNRGSNDILIVSYVEHHPVKVPTSPMARPDPYVAIYAAYHSSFGD